MQQAATKPMIQMYGVQKRYNRRLTALEDVSLQVDRGEFVFVTGPSGAGKTTLLKLLFREILPTQGQIIVNGRNVTALPPSKIPRLRRSIGVVFQDFRLIGSKTVLENITFVYQMFGLPRRERRRRAFHCLRRVGLQQRINEYPACLSGGEQQRVAIARAIANDPVLVLADEPTGNIDQEMSERILRIFKEINSRGTTVLLATHDHRLLSQVDARRIGLEQGRLLHDSATCIGDLQPRDWEVSSATRGKL